jgi:hypothetical protein
MWQARRVTRVDVRAWLWVGACWWLMPALAFSGWAAGHQSGAPWRGALQAGMLYVCVLAARTAAVYGYNATGERAGMVLILEDAHLMAIDWRSAVPAALWTAVLEGGALTAVLAAQGWLGGLLRLAGWVAATAAPVAMGAAVLGTVVLYNRWVVPFYGPLGWEESLEAGHMRIRRFDPNQVRLVAATLWFAWVMAVLLVVVGGLLVALTVLAGHLPAGTLGVGVAVFTGFVLALAGFLAAVAWGWWMYGLTLAYNRWSAAGGGLRFHVVSQEVAL